MNFVDKPSKTLLTLGQKIDKHQHSPELLDQSRNIARFSAFLDVMEGRFLPKMNQKDEKTVRKTRIHLFS